MREFLVEAYRGELFGIEFFKAFSEKAKDVVERDKWMSLIELECHTAALLKTWLEQQGQACAADDPEMKTKGREIAAPWLDLPWQTLMDTLSPWIEGYAVKYRDKAESVPSDQYQICDMTAAHEEAIFAFVQSERAGERDSLKAVREFMNNYRTL
jgi:hypothetical protein